MPLAPWTTSRASGTVLVACGMKIKKSEFDLLYMIFLKTTLFVSSPLHQMKISATLLFKNFIVGLAAISWSPALREFPKKKTFCQHIHFHQGRHPFWTHSLHGKELLPSNYVCHYLHNQSTTFFQGRILQYPSKMVITFNKHFQNWRELCTFTVELPWWIIEVLDESTLPRIHLYS